MIGNSRNVHTDILCRLFCTYSCSFYGSELWGCNSTGSSRIVTEWHKAVRRVIQLPYCTHRWLPGLYSNASAFALASANAAFAFALAFECPEVGAFAFALAFES